ncbi:helix-turn-helix transcriptional regulator [uncultured Cohaesibacter sp.]|uniref:helix-turn-helix transcriptional regulator n=1 Tax=uncultured Cohaesibacter sp. TaxID=1002546 RepID=UPI0029C7F7E6|nr:helix-turn-helix transcriptional regulator [uncultured Cohaesibacter sp.]
MLSHEAIWKAIDGLASRNNLSPSALARRAGLDPTSFNPSKRIKSDGRPRWPSTESIAKILDATDTGIADFFAPILPVESHRKKGSKGPPSWSIQAIVNQTVPQQWPRVDDDGGAPSLSSAPDSKSSASHSAGKANSRHGDQPSLFVLEVSGDQFRPFYRNGDKLLLSVDLGLAPGDRVVVHCQRDGLVAGEIRQVRKRSLSLSMDFEHKMISTFALSHVKWVARIVWVSQ